MAASPPLDPPLGSRGDDVPSAPASGGVRVTAESGVAVLNVWGCLDAGVGAAVRAAAERAIHQRARRLDIDLRQVAAFTVDGAVALRDCRVGGASLQEGLHYRTGRGPGRQALLAAYAPAAHWDTGVEPTHP